EATRERWARRRFDRGTHRRSPRTAQAVGVILGDRGVRRAEYPELDDVRLGVFESRDVDDYREWRQMHRPDERPPGGESRLDALGRYADGFERMLGEPARDVLAVIHDVPIRFMLNPAE